MAVTRRLISPPEVCGYCGLRDHKAHCPGCGRPCRGDDFCSCAEQEEAHAWVPPKSDAPVIDWGNI